MTDDNDVVMDKFPHVDCDDNPDCQGECCDDCEDSCCEEAPWGAHPCDTEAPFKIGAEAVMLKMHTEEGEAVEVSLLQVVNQMFLDKSPVSAV